MLALALAPNASAQEALDANCPGPREMSFSSMGGGTSRFAQTFTAGITGGLTTAQVEVTKFGSAGDYRLDLNETDAAGAPTNTTLASATIPDADVPAGASVITGSFASPASVSAGQQYTLIVTRPASNGLQVGTRTGDDCGGGLFFSNTQTGTFNSLGATYDLIFAVFVLENDPPETAITKGPKNKTRKRSASIEFTSDEPGSTFACSLDGAAFEPCSSPAGYEHLKRRKHHFEVRATDAAGNVDGTPATFDWKIKKKHR
jgi:hypothetical protein